MSPAIIILTHFAGALKSISRKHHHNTKKLAEVKCKIIYKCKKQNALYCHINRSVSMEEPNGLDDILLISLTLVKSRLSKPYFLLDSYLAVAKMFLTSIIRGFCVYNFEYSILIVINNHNFILQHIFDFYCLDYQELS